MNKSPVGKQTVQREGNAGLVRDMLASTCIWFTVLFLLVILFGAVASGSFTMNYIHTVRYLLLIPFAFCLTLAGMVRRSSLPVAARAVLHLICSVGGFYLCVYLPYQLESKPLGRNVLIIMLLSLVVWLIAFFIYLGITRRRSRRAIEEKPYVSQFRKNDTNRHTP